MRLIISASNKFKFKALIRDYFFADKDLQVNLLASGAVERLKGSEFVIYNGFKWVFKNNRYYLYAV